MQSGAGQCLNYVQTPSESAYSTTYSRVHNPETIKCNASNLEMLKKRKDKSNA